MRTVRKHKGINWGVASPEGDLLWPDGLSHYASLIWIIGSAELKQVRPPDGGKFKAVFCIGNGCDAIFHNLKKQTGLYINADNLGEAVRMAGMFAADGDTVVLTSGDEREFKELVDKYD